MFPCFLVLHFSPKPWLLLGNAKFPPVFGPVPQGHRKDCFVALPVCPASSQPSDRSSSSTRQCHWRGGDRSISTKHVKVWSQDRGCYEVSCFLLANMSCLKSTRLYHLDFLQISKRISGLTDLLSLQRSITCLNSPSALRDTDLILRPPRLYCSMVPTLPGSPCKTQVKRLHHIASHNWHQLFAKVARKNSEKRMYRCTTIAMRRENAIKIMKLRWFPFLVLNDVPTVPFSHDQGMENQPCIVLQGQP